MKRGSCNVEIFQQRYNRDVIGIDVGITMLMAENLRTRFVWNTFMNNPEVVSTMKKAGFVKTDPSINF